MSLAIISSTDIDIKVLLLDNISILLDGRSVKKNLNSKNLWYRCQLNPSLGSHFISAYLSFSNEVDLIRNILFQFPLKSHFLWDSARIIGLSVSILRGFHCAGLKKGCLYIGLSSFFSVYSSLCFKGERRDMIFSRGGVIIKSKYREAISA